MGVAYGSCTGSPDAVADFGTMLVNGDVGRDRYHLHS